MGLATKRRALIVLLTDFGADDEYVGVMKGVISSINPEAKTIDLCHEVSPQDIMEAGFILYKSYKYFPKETIFLVVVDPGVGTRRRAVVLEAAGYYFVAPDNGVLSFILRKEKVSRIVELTNRRYFLAAISRTFHGRDLFAPAAAHLSRGVDPARFGSELKELIKLNISSPSVSPKGSLVGEVIHIDRFGNLITNIDHESFGRFQKNHPVGPFKIRVGRKTVPKLVNFYSETRAGELLAIFGSSDHLEISLNLGSAQDALGVKKGVKVELKALT